MSPPSLWSPDIYVAAFQFAAAAHRGQTVPGSDLPYLLHVGMVAMEVTGALAVETFARPDLAIQCALLHDCVEDTAVTADDIARHFGDDVAAGVQALTKANDPAQTKTALMADSLRRIVAQPPEVWLVKLADRVCNLQPPPAYWTAAKRAAYRVEAADILAALGAASPYLAARLEAKIAAYGALAALPAAPTPSPS